MCCARAWTPARPIHVAAPSDLAAVLDPLPAQVARRPTLLRRDGDAAVLFVPAVYPRATEIEIDGEADDWHSWTQGLRYRFAPRRTIRSMSSWPV